MDIKVEDDMQLNWLNPKFAEIIFDCLHISMLLLKQMHLLVILRVEWIVGLSLN